jgi:hypothetical protein
MRRQETTSAYLLVDSSDPGLRFPLESDLTVGRHEDCVIRVDEPIVSRRHATITATAEGVFVVDHGSANGTLVGGVRIRGGRASLAAGKRVRIGSRELTLVRGRDGAAPRRWIRLRSWPARAALGLVFLTVTGAALLVREEVRPAAGTGVAAAADSLAAAAQFEEAESLLKANTVADRGNPVIEYALEKVARARQEYIKDRLALGRQRGELDDWVGAAQAYDDVKRVAPDHEVALAGHEQAQDRIRFRELLAGAERAIRDGRAEDAAEALRQARAFAHVTDRTPLDRLAVDLAGLRADNALEAARNAVDRTDYREADQQFSCAYELAEPDSDRAGIIGRERAAALRAWAGRLERSHDWARLRDVAGALLSMDPEARDAVRWRARAKENLAAQSHANRRYNELLRHAEDAARYADCDGMERFAREALDVLSGGRRAREMLQKAEKCRQAPDAEDEDSPEERLRRAQALWLDWGSKPGHEGKVKEALRLLDSAASDPAAGRELSTRADTLARQIQSEMKARGDE